MLKNWFITKNLQYFSDTISSPAMCPISPYNSHTTIESLQLVGDYLPEGATLDISCNPSFSLPVNTTSTLTCNAGTEISITNCSGIGYKLRLLKYWFIIVGNILATILSGLCRFNSPSFQRYAWYPLPLTHRQRTIVLVHSWGRDRPSPSLALVRI